nr:HD domain-containing protein [Clostridium sp. MCC353]
MARGGWTGENIHQCPVTLNWENCSVSWVEHVRDVTEMCIREFVALEKYYQRNQVDFSRDRVIAGALLHDIGKLTEFLMEDGKVCYSPEAQLMRHPLSGAVLAAQAGLPNHLVHLIATHSFEGDQSCQTPESEFVRTIDLFVFRCSVKGLKKKNC